MTRSSESGQPSDAKRRISVGDVGTPPKAAPFSLSLAIEDPWVTTAGTAVLEATISNTGEQTNQLGPAYYKGSSGPGGQEGVLLYSEDAPDSPPPDYVPPCFQETPSDGYIRTYTSGGEQHVAWTLEYPLGQELAPGESSTSRLLVADDPTVNGCLPPGQYQFVEPHSYGSDESFEWKWSLSVEDVSDE